ncbi:MAG: hypothetical protein Q7T61_05770 [Caulobacter sp.]|nr:hypothetical protein [Caulobacter sp.]
MIRKFAGPFLLLALLVIGDQIRIHRPDHKFRLTMEVETPQGVRSASGVFAVHPDRGYTKGGSTQTKGDAIVVDLGGGKNLVALLAHHGDRGIELDDINYVAVRAFGAAGQRAIFRQMDKVTGSAPVMGSVIPVLATFADIADPATMREVKPDAVEAALGQGVRLKGLSVEVVPNGVWPIDFGGFLGEPVTHGVVAKLPWLKQQPDGASRAVQAAALPMKSDADARLVFVRE